MAVEDLSNYPQNVTDEMWYYEERKGINVVYEIRHRGKYVRTDQILIPWGKVERSIKRLHK